MAEVQEFSQEGGDFRKFLSSSSNDEFAAAMGLKDATAPEVEEPEVPVEEEVEEDPIHAVRTPTKVDSEKREAKKVRAQEPIEQDNGEEAEPEEEELPEAVKVEAEVKTGEQAAEEKKLLTEFVLKDNGEEVEIPTTVTLDLKANGKEYKDVPLDKIVLLAKMGFYNQQREDDVAAAKTFVLESQQREQQYVGVVQKLQAEFDAILADENYYDAARQQYLRNNSPEARARRAEDALQQQRATANQQALRSQAEGYIAQNIYPAVQQVLQKFPKVSEDEVLGRFNRLILPMLQNGVVPPHLLPEVKRLVDTDLVNWATQVSLERDASQKKVDDTIKAEKVKTALAKRQVARTVAPSQGSSSTTKETRKPRKYASATDWAKNAVDDILKDSFNR